mmetsp:Transcript_4948/g.14803  ORF Transcript_4948/g.14803 Transcript_4948/m.14803 type:complete len:391 (-) Transcript_4948:157-1329(-)
MSSPITMVRDASMVEDSSEALKSADTRGLSVTARTPLRWVSAASLSTALTSSAKVFFSTWMTRSTTDTFGVGTRRAIPVSLPSRLGTTRATALAAPVDVGTMFRAAALALLMSLWDASRSLWSPVYECVVVISPLTIPNFSSRTLAKGARQLVVHEAFDTILAFMSRSCSFTPTTWVGMSLPLAGAVMRTFFAPAVMCLPAPSVFRKTPVPSITRSIPMSFQGSWVGSRFETTSMTLPLQLKWVSSTISMSASNVPSIESYFRRWDACFTPPLSLTATTSRSEFSLPSRHLKKLRPILPKPLIATFTLALVTWREPADLSAPLLVLLAVLLSIMMMMMKPSLSSSSSSLALLAPPSSRRQLRLSDLLIHTNVLAISLSWLQLTVDNACNG